MNYIDGKFNNAKTRYKLDFYQKFWFWKRSFDFYNETQNIRAWS